MKSGIGKRIGSGILALAMTATLYVGGSASVFAGDTYPYVGESASGENQPYQHGYRVEDLMNWSPETDPYAELMRAQVPLQNRNEAFAATQANPNLESKAQYLTLTGDYGNSFFNSNAYTNEFSTHVFNFWQYVDQYASWHGVPSVGTPEELNDIEDERNATDGNAWKRRYFEFGLVNLPNPAYTNAAHKNGVLSLGCMFQPRAYQNFEVMLYTDENGRYPVADKLTEIAEYYGFDGYFFNMEGRSYSAAAREKLKAFFAQMRADGMYIQWYNAGSFNTNMLTSAKADNYEDATLYANSVFIEYGHSVPGDEATAPFGLDKFQVAFNGFEAGANRWRNDFSRLMKDGVMNGSIASLGTDFVQTGLEQQAGVDAETGYRLFTRELDEYQWMAFERERLWWTGNNNRNTTVLNPGLTEDTATIEANDFTGIADYIAERTVVNGDTFYTNFNTGHGLEYVVNGQVSSSSEWSNINIQDILPTWQWWFESEGTKLSAEFDYGSKYRKVYNGGEEGSFGFDLVGAYNGGSSLAVYGALNAENFLHLYKTDLSVSENSKMDITFKKTSDDAASMKLGVIFEDNTDEIVKLDIANSAVKSEGWVTSTVDLSAYAGKQIAAFGLVFDGEAADYQMNIGQMKYTSGEAVVPAKPTGLTIKKAYETGEMTISWDMASYDEVKQYNVYAVKEGKEIFLGGTYDENFYIKNINEAIAEAEAVHVDSVTVSPKAVDAVAGDTVDFDAKVNGYSEEKGQVTIVLKAVSADGTESEGAMTSHNYDEAVKNVTVDNSVDGKLALTWDGGEADVTVSTAYEKERRTWTASGNNGCTVEVPTGADANGADITITITTKSGVSTMVDAKLPDKYCAPYNGKIWPSDGRFTQPSSSEWYELHYQTVTNGERGEEDYYVRGKAMHNELNNDWSMFQAISNDADGVYVWIVDYKGNKSEEVYVPNRITVTVLSEMSSVQAGTSSQFTANVKNFTETGAVTWSISGNNSEGTKIDENGLLTIAEEESASYITVTASSVENSAAFGSQQVAVSPAYALIADTDTAYKGDTVNLAVYHKGAKLPTEDYTWSVEPAWGNMSENTTIENGVLVISADEAAYTLTVTASKGELSYTLSLSVADLYSLDPNWTQVAKGATQQFTVKNNKTGESVPGTDFTWSLSSPYAEWYGDITSADTKVDENGLFTMGADEECEYIQLAAQHKTTGAEFTTFISQPWGYSLSTASVEEAPVSAPAPTNTEPAVSQEVTWTVEGAKSADTKVDENGTLTIGIDETAEQLTVTATSVVDGTKSDTAVVNVTPREKFYVEVIAGEHGAVTPGSGEFYEDTDVTFTFTPDEGYAVDKVTVDGEEVTLTDGKYTLTVTGTTQIEVSFKVNADAPDTGDYTPILAAALFAMLAAAGAAIYTIRRRRA